MSTQVGLHVGSCIKATGKDGFLMYGPHRAIAQGNYNVTIFDNPLDRTSGQLTIDFIANKGKTCFWRGTIDVVECDQTEETPLLTFAIALDDAVYDYEIRCIVGSSKLNLVKLIITKII